MLKFQFHNGQIIRDPNTELVEEFVTIINYGEKKKDPDLAVRMLLYVFYCCDLTNDNPIRDVDHRMKEENALKMSLTRHKKSNFTKQEYTMLHAAMDAYNFFNENALERVALSYDKKIDELRTRFETLELEIHHVIDPDTNQVTRIVSNEKIIENVANSIVNMANNKLKALEASKKIESKGRVRGDKGSSLIEKGRFRKDKDVT